MSYISNKPFPPIVDTWSPAAIYGDNLKVYFNISAYADISSVRKDIVHVRITHQQTNKSIVNTENNNGYENLFCKMRTDEEGRYYILISHAKVNVEIDQIYKIQLRFLSAETDVSTTTLYSKMRQYEDYFSEWSNICLLKVISLPTLNLKQFQGVNNLSLAVLSTSSIHLLGELIFADSAETDVLQDYRVVLSLQHQQDDDYDIIVNTPTLYSVSANPNEINYIIKNEVKNHRYYLLQIFYTTTSGYMGKQEFKFWVEFDSRIRLPELSMNLSMNKEDGCVDIKITQEDESDLYNGYFILQRSSSKTNFTIWDDYRYFLIENTPINIDYTDRTVQSGILYKYQIIPLNNRGYRGVPVSFEEDGIIFVDFEHICLVASDDEQVNVKYDANIGSFQYVVVESKADTLGGKYPFIRRNGDTYYRQFDLEGTITHFNLPDNVKEHLAENVQINDSYTENDGTDYIDTFQEKKKKFVSQNDDDILQLYDNKYYNETNKAALSDYLVEKEYRDYVISFLYDNKIRLFKSPTEGNILIKLMNVTFTPNQQLDRRIWKFKATAYELNDCTYENICEYKIHDNGAGIFQDIEQKVDSFAHIGQIIIDRKATPNFIGSPLCTENLFELINEDVQEHAMHNFLSLSDVAMLRFTFYSPSETFYVYSNTSSENNTAVALSTYADWKNAQKSKSKNKVYTEKSLQLAQSGYKLTYETLGLNSEFLQRMAKEGIKRNELVQTLQCLGDVLAQNQNQIPPYVTQATTTEERRLRNSIMSQIKEILIGETDLVTKGLPLLLLEYSTNDELMFNDELISQCLQTDDELNITSAEALALTRANSEVEDFWERLIEVPVNTDRIDGFDSYWMVIRLICDISKIINKIGKTAYGAYSAEVLEETLESGMAQGYQITINGNDIIVAPHGNYEFADPDVPITEAEVHWTKTNDMKVVIDYIAQYRGYNANINEVTMKSLYRYYITGQYQITDQDIEGNHDLIQIIKDKYDTSVMQLQDGEMVKVYKPVSENGQLISRRIVAIPYVSLEGRPGQLFRYDVDNKTNVSFNSLIMGNSAEDSLHCLNTTGVFTLFDKNIDVTFFALTRGVFLPDYAGTIYHNYSDAMLGENLGMDCVESDIPASYFNTETTGAMHGTALLNYVVYVEEARY